MMTTVTPAGPMFFCAPAYISAWRPTSIGRLNMSDEVSLTSGAPPASGRSRIWVPSIVLFDVMWTYAAPVLSFNSDCAGTAEYPSPFVAAALWTVPTRVGLFVAVSGHDRPSLYAAVVPGGG